MVDAMIARPVVDGALVGDGVAEHEGEADGEGGGVGAVGPEAVDSYGDAEAAVESAFVRREREKSDVNDDPTVTNGSPAPPNGRQRT